MWRNFKRWSIWTSAAIVIALAVLFCVAELMIGSGVREFSEKAQTHFPGDRNTALIAMVECGSCRMSDRNHAVWALGQIADQRALQILEKHYTGKPCNHQRTLCQYELEKALRLVRSGHNTESFFWRWMLPSQVRAREI